MNISDTLSLIALLISIITAYKTLFSRFNGRVWFSDKIILLTLDNIPSICLPCSIENSGAKPGTLDDIRVIIKTKNNQAQASFYPLLVRDNYTIHGVYTSNDWWQFGTISLPEKSRKESYIFFKPLNDNYSAISGEMEICLQVRWHNKTTWENVGKKVKFTLTNEIANHWNTTTTPPIQISSDDFMTYRGNQL